MQAADRGLGLLAPAHMGVAGGEHTIRAGRTGLILDRQTQPRGCLFEFTFEEVRRASRAERLPRPLTRAKAQGLFDMFNSCIRLAGPQSNDGTDEPAPWD